MTNKRIDHKVVAAAIASSDSDVEAPLRSMPGSLTSQIAALAVGDCVSKTTPLDPALTLVEFQSQGATLREQLRNRVTPSVTQAKAKTKNSYTIELGTLVTTANNVYLVAVVTRTA